MDDTWHLVWVDQETNGFHVRCHPHGTLGIRDTFFAAFLHAFEHDFEIRGDLDMPGYTTEKRAA
jgi:hypothetical protein